MKPVLKNKARAEKSQPAKKAKKKMRRNPVQPRTENAPEEIRKPVTGVAEEKQEKMDEDMGE
jgi:hypothetical protein